MSKYSTIYFGYRTHLLSFLWLNCSIIFNNKNKCSYTTEWEANEFMKGVAYKLETEEEYVETELFPVGVIICIDDVTYIGIGES